MIALDGNNFQIIDLTHQLSDDIPTWSGSKSFELHTNVDYGMCPGAVKFRVQALEMSAGIGTHMDAPAHCIPGGATIDTIPLEKLCAPCIKIDVSDRAHERYSVSRADIVAWEDEHGTIQAGSFVLICTGWAKYWNNPEQYHNKHKFPSVSAGAALLLRERGIVGLGIDTLSPDRPEDEFAVHQLLLGAGIYLVENVAHAEKLPVIGATLFVIPILIAGGTEAPVRLFGLVPV